MPRFTTKTDEVKFNYLSKNALGTKSWDECVKSFDSKYRPTSWQWFPDIQEISNIKFNKAKCFDLNNKYYTDASGNKGLCVYFFDETELDCKNLIFGTLAFGDYNLSKKHPQKIVRNLTVYNQWTFFSNQTIEEVYNMKVLGAMYGQFEGARNIRIIKGLDLSKATNEAQMFNSYGGINLEVLEFTGLHFSLDISNCTKLPREQLVNIFKNGLEEVTNKTLTIGSTLMAKLTEEDISIATKKGWTIA